MDFNAKVCQRPKRAFSISTLSADANDTPEKEKVCQRPKRAFSISTKKNPTNNRSTEIGVNALNGLFPFLRYPLKPRINTGFPALFLQVFI